MKVYLIETAEPVERRFECGVAGELILYSEQADAEVAAAEYNVESSAATWRLPEEEWSNVSLRLFFQTIRFFSIGTTAFWRICCVHVKA